MWHNLTQLDSSIISACWVQFQNIDHSNIFTGAKLIFPDKVEFGLVLENEWILFTRLQRAKYF